MSQKTIDRIMQLAESLTPEETAKVAGMLMDFVGVSKDTCEAFLAELNESDRGELLCRLDPDE